MQKVWKTTPELIAPTAALAYECCETLSWRLFELVHQQKSASTVSSRIASSAAFTGLFRSFRSEPVLRCVAETQESMEGRNLPRKQSL